MTEAEKALEAYDKYITYLSGETLEKSVTSQEIAEWDETIRKALQGVDKNEKLISAAAPLIEYAIGNVKSWQKNPENKRHDRRLGVTMKTDCGTCYDIFDAFNSDETGVGL